MIHEQKELLLKDLCARLPYKVKAQIPDEYGGYTSAIETIDLDGFVVDFEGTQIEVEYIKPYLYPMSSMTEEQKKELQSLMIRDSYNILYHTIESFDYLYKNHIDIRGLIPMGLAIDCTNLKTYLY